MPNEREKIINKLKLANKAYEKSKLYGYCPHTDEEGYETGLHRYSGNYSDQIADQISRLIKRL